MLQTVLHLNIDLSSLHQAIDSSSLNELTKSALALDKEIKINIDGSATTNELIKSFQSSSEKKIFHKLLKHIIPGINLKLYKHDCHMNNDDKEPQLASKNIEASWCCPSLNYWNIFNQFIITTLLNDG